MFVSEKELCEDLRVIVIENLIEGGAYAFNFHLPGVSENMFSGLLKALKGVPIIQMLPLFKSSASRHFPFLHIKLHNYSNH